MLGATGATIHHSTRFDSMPDDPAFTMAATRRKSMDRAFERVEVMGNAVHQDFEWLVILVAAHFAGLDPGVKLVLRVSREVWLQNPRRVLLFMTFNHAHTLA
jgi:hypothetical protein